MSTPTVGTNDPMAALTAALSGLQAGGASSASAQQFPGQGVTRAEAAAYKVYMGPSATDHSKDTTYSGVDTSSLSGIESASKTSDQVMGIDEANAEIYDMTKYKQFEQFLLHKGVIQPGQYTVTDVVNEWQNAVQQAALFYKRGTKMTPEQFVDMNIGLNGGNNTSHTTTATSVNEVDPASARAALDSAFNSLLGRDPTNTEREAFYQKALEDSQNRPSTTTTTTTGSGLTGNTTSNTSSDTAGGYSSADLQNAAQDTAKSSTDYGPHMAATSAFNWLQQAIRGG